MINLEQTLDTKNLILFDTSARKSFRRFHKDFDKCIRYDHINKKDIKQELIGIDNMMYILINKSTRTIPEVTTEIIRYKHSIKRNNNRLSLLKIKGKGRENQRLLLQLYEKVKLIAKESRKKELEIMDPRYKILTEMVVLLSKTLDSKRKTSHLYKDYIAQDNKLFTDEKLVAITYYFSLRHEKPRLITTDTDFVRFFAETPVLMASDIFSPYNDTFREMFKIPHDWLYLSREDGLYERFQYSKNSEKFIHFNLINKRHFQNEMIKEQMLELWKQYTKIQ